MDFPKVWIDKDGDLLTSDCDGGYYMLAGSGMIPPEVIAEMHRRLTTEPPAPADNSDLEGKAWFTSLGDAVMFPSGAMVAAGGAVSATVQQLNNEVRRLIIADRAERGRVQDGEGVVFKHDMAFTITHGNASYDLVAVYTDEDMAEFVDWLNWCTGPGPATVEEV